MIFDRRATKQPAKAAQAFRLGSAPASHRVAGSLNRSQLFASPATKAFGAPNAAIRASDLVH